MPRSNLANLTRANNYFFEQSSDEQTWKPKNEHFSDRDPLKKIER